MTTASTTCWSSCPRRGSPRCLRPPMPPHRWACLFVTTRPAARASSPLLGDRAEDRPGWHRGAVTQERTAGPRGGSPVMWHARTCRGEPLCDVDGRGWPTRIRATAALLWHCPASGARCAALAAHVRALCDDALKDLLADLPPHRFTELLLAALDVTAEGGVAA